MIPLMSVIKVRMQRGATQIQRSDRQTALDIQASLATGKTTPEARKAMETVLKRMRFPPGYSWSFGGRFNDSEDAGQVMVFNRSEEHTSELQSLMRISYAVFCLKKKKKINK